MTEIITVFNTLKVGSKVAFQLYHDNQMAKVRDIIIDAIKKTGSALLLQNDDDAITLIEMFLNAQRLGAAKENLNLMARALCNLSKTMQPLYPSKFRKYSRVLAELTSEEIIVLSVFYRQYIKFKDELSGNVQEDKILSSLLWERVKNEVVQFDLMSGAEMESSAYACQRYGLLVPDQTLDGIGYLKVTPFLLDLVELSELQMQKYGL